jgi:hypothetical protein
MRKDEVVSCLSCAADSALRLCQTLRTVPRPSSRGRSFRTTLLLAAIAVLNTFDLAFTQTQMARGNFAEANVLAASAADQPAGMAVYKIALFGLGALILYRCRRHWQSEVGAWLLLACYAGLMVWWGVYLNAVEVCLSDPAVGASLAMY